MIRKLTTEEKKKLEPSFVACNYLVKDSEAFYVLFSCLKSAAKTLKCSVPKALEIILQEFRGAIEERIGEELKGAGIPREEIDETVAIFMQMIKPQTSKNSSVTKSRDLVSPEKKEIRSEGGFGV